MAGGRTPAAAGNEGRRAQGSPQWGVRAYLEKYTARDACGPAQKSRRRSLLRAPARPARSEDSSSAACASLAAFVSDIRPQRGCQLHLLQITRQRQQQVDEAPSALRNFFIRCSSRELTMCVARGRCRPIPRLPTSLCARAASDQRAPIVQNGKVIGIVRRGKLVSRLKSQSGAARPGQRNRATVAGRR
jgi:hypothetical protein